MSELLLGAHADLSRKSGRRWRESLGTLIALDKARTAAAGVDIAPRSPGDGAAASSSSAGGVCPGGGGVCAVSVVY